MTLNSMNMAPTLPEGDILNEFENLEQSANNVIVGFAELVHQAYHRGALMQQVRCMVQYMYHCRKTYEEAWAVFHYPLILSQNLQTEVKRYYAVYSTMQEKGKAQKEAF